MDLTLYDLGTGEAAEMPSLYDEMTDRSYLTTPAASGRSARAAHGSRRFTVYEAEWSHVEYRDRQHYPVLNLTFEEPDAAR